MCKIEKVDETIAGIAGSLDNTGSGKNSLQFWFRFPF